MVRIASALLGALVAGFTTAPAAAQPTVTATEIHTAPPEQTHQRLRDLVWRLFEQRDYRNGEPPRGPLEKLTLTTRPRATEIPGLCRIDSILIDFAPLTPGADGADTPVRPVAVTSYPLYSFLRAPTAGYYRTRELNPTPDAAACTSPDIARLDFFTAEEDRIATDATPLSSNSSRPSSAGAASRSTATGRTSRAPSTASRRPSACRKRSTASTSATLRTRRSFAGL
jgi:hypothetical protein